MKQRTRILAISLCLLFLFGALTGCAATASSNSKAAAPTALADTAAAEAKPAEFAESPAASEEWAYDESADTVSSLNTQSYEGQGTLEAGTGSDLSAEKLIYSADVYLQTTQFDKSMQTLEGNVFAAGGFVESSNVYGDVVYNDDGTTHVVNRRAYYTVRIPAAQFDAFLTQTDGLGNVLSSSREAQNVTSSYTDYEARLSSLNTQEERLLDMLSKTTDVDSLVALEQRLSDVRYEIESIERNLRNLDRQITYSTVSLTLEEVEVYTPTVPVQRTFGEKMANAFADGWIGFVRGVQRFCINMASAAPALVLLVILVIAVLLILRRIRKNRAQKRAAAQQPADETTQTGK